MGPKTRSQKKRRKDDTSSSSSSTSPCPPSTPSSFAPSSQPSRSSSPTSTRMASQTSSRSSGELNRKNGKSRRCRYIGRCVRSVAGCFGGYSMVCLITLAVLLPALLIVHRPAVVLELFRRIGGAAPENEVSKISSTISRTTKVRIPRILLWTQDGQKPLFQEDSLRETGRIAPLNCLFSMRHSLPQDPFEDSLPSCHVTKDHSYLKLCDAVVFDSSTIHSTPPPRFRDPRQIWVFYTHRDSAPTTSIGLMSAYSFNWTMAQRTDADVVIPFGNWTLTGQPASRDFPTKRFQKYRTALSFASDCDGQTTNYVLKAVLRALEGTLVSNCGKDYCDGRTMCVPELQDFYFLFIPEYSGCHEHPSESIYNAFQYDLLPVYFGKADLTGLVPENSYVSAYSLMPEWNITAYLRTLMLNFDLYSAFFKWRETHVISQRHKLCYLCDSLRENLVITSRHLNVLYWWKKTKLCHLDHKLNKTQKP